MLTSAFCCGNFGTDDLKIVCDPANGVYVEGSAMHVEDYFEIALVDAWCPEKEFELGYKDVVYLESQGNQFPYCATSPTTYSICADPVEWDSLTHYGTPNPSIAFSPYVTNVDPSFDCATGVTKGREDCYSYNPYFDLDAAGVPWNWTGYAEFAINLPPNNPYDPGVWPNNYFRLCSIQGTNFSWTTVMPPPPTAPAAPTNVQGAVSQNKNVSLTWDANGSTEWIIQKFYVVKIQGQTTLGQPSGAPIPASSNLVQIVPGKGNWMFSVKAVNCPTESSATYSPALKVNK